MSNEKQQLIDLYKDYKARCLFLGEEPKEIRVDQFSYIIDDEDRILLTDWYDSNLYGSIDILLPDYFDGIASIHSFSSIKNLIINNSAIFISNDALKHLNVRYIDLNNVEILGNSAISFTNVKEIKAEKLKYICDSALSYNTNLKELYFPNVEVCYDFAFCSCKKLEKVIFNNLRLFYTNTFHLCESLSYVDLGGKVVEIPYQAFIGNNLERIIGLDSVEKVNARAFMYNDKLKYIDLSNCMLIGESAFQSTNLKKIKLSDSLVGVGDSAFNINNSLFSRLQVDYIGYKKHFLNGVYVSNSNNYLKWAKVKIIKESEV